MSKKVILLQRRGWQEYTSANKQKRYTHGCGNEDPPFVPAYCRGEHLTSHERDDCGGRKSRVHNHSHSKFAWRLFLIQGAYVVESPHRTCHKKGGKTRRSATIGLLCRSWKLFLPPLRKTLHSLPRGFFDGGGSAPHHSTWERREGDKRGGLKGTDQVSCTVP